MTLSSFFSTLSLQDNDSASTGTGSTTSSTSFILVTDNAKSHGLLELLAKCTRSSRHRNKTVLDRWQHAPLPAEPISPFRRSSERATSRWESGLKPETPSKGRLASPKPRFVKPQLPRRSLSSSEGEELSCCDSDYNGTSSSSCCSSGSICCSSGSSCSSIPTTSIPSALRASRQKLLQKKQQARLSTFTTPDNTSSSTPSRFHKEDSHPIQTPKNEQSSGDRRTVSSPYGAPILPRRTMLENIDLALLETGLAHSDG
jgi:hypothetical protein